MTEKDSSIQGLLGLRPKLHPLALLSGAGIKGADNPAGMWMEILAQTLQLSPVLGGLKKTGSMNDEASDDAYGGKNWKHLVDSLRELGIAPAEKNEIGSAISKLTEAFDQQDVQKKGVGVQVEENARAKAKAPTANQLHQEILDYQKEIKTNFERIDSDIDTQPISSNAQCEILILCPHRGRSGARFGVYNPLADTMDLELIVRMGAGVPQEVQEKIKIKFDPPKPTLDQGAVATVRLAVDLSECITEGLEELRFHIESASSGRCLSTAWVEIKLLEM